MSGIDADGSGKDELDLLEAVLDRRAAVQPLLALTRALSDRTRQDIDLGRVALGFDSSVFLRLATDPRSADILDYLPHHKAPLILPGQAIQEFWNNRLSVVRTVSGSLKSSFSQFAAEARRIDPRFGDFEEEMTSILANFEAEFGYMYDERTGDSVSKMLATLQERAYCAFVPRNRFSPIAQLRKRTKTPPGFKDDGDGDFFVWADFLYGLLTIPSSVDAYQFERVVLLTEERKPDWSTHDMPHPILSAEVHSLFKVPFDLWNLKRFASEVENAV